MATQSWPSVLPLPAINYAIEPENAVLETTFETGVPLQRLRFDVSYEMVSATWEFTNQEYLIFKNWFAAKIARGTIKFNCNLYLGGSLDSYETQWVSGQTPYQVNHYGVLFWRVSATLLIQDTKELSEAALDLMLSGDDQAFVLSVGGLNSFIEDTMPATDLNLP